MTFSLRHSIPLLLFILLVVIALMGLYANIFGQRQPQQLPSVLLGKPAPDNIMPLLAGGNLSLQQYRGQMVVVNIFASWCLPCRIEAPALDYLAEFLPVVGIAYKDKPTDTQRFLQQYGNPFREILVDTDGRYSQQWGSTGVPETYLLNAQGEIIWRHTGVLERATIDNTLLQLTRQP